MATKAKSIASADLATFAKAAAKAVTQSPKIIKGPIWGYILQEDIGGPKALEAATQVAAGVAANAKAAGIGGLKVQPAVVFKPGKIIAGFIQAELNMDIR